MPRRLVASLPRAKDAPPRSGRVTSLYTAVLIGPPQVRAEAMTTLAYSGHSCHTTRARLPLFCPPRSCCMVSVHTAALIGPSLARAYSGRSSHTHRAIVPLLCPPRFLSTALSCRPHSLPVSLAILTPFPSYQTPGGLVSAAFRIVPCRSGLGCWQEVLTPSCADM